MATFNIQVMVMVILVVFGISISNHENGLVAAQNKCHVNVNDLISKCMKYVRKAGPKKDPSKECCAVIKKVDVPCVCKNVTKEIEKMLSMEKVVYVAEFCGVKVRHGMKCGSYIVPMKLVEEKNL